MTDWGRASEASGFGSDPSNVFVPASSTDDSTSNYPPTALLVAAVSMVILTTVFFLVGSRMLNWFGYVTGCFLTATAVVVYRHVDASRQALPRYVPKPLNDRVAAGCIVAGVALGALHVWFALQETVVL